jgi:GNAT superfamily N-acetyltransferase
VGSACYAISPLNDRLYVFEIEIAPEHRRQGFGTAYLKHLSETHRLPLTPIKELYSSHRFWEATRRLAGTGLKVTAEISVSDMDAEARRWAHLEADRERLYRLIRERLFVHCEPWDVAVGRGLDG